MACTGGESPHHRGVPLNSDKKSVKSVSENRGFLLHAHSVGDNLEQAVRREFEMLYEYQLFIILGISIELLNLKCYILTWNLEEDYTFLQRNLDHFLLYTRPHEVTIISFTGLPLLCTGKFVIRSNTC